MGEWVTDEVWLLEEGRRLASQRDDLIAAGADPAELLVPIAPAVALHLERDERFAGIGRRLDEALGFLAEGLARLDWSAITHAWHRIVLAWPHLSFDRRDRAVARSCTLCCPGTGASHPAPLAIDGHAYRRRSRRRRR